MSNLPKEWERVRNQLLDGMDNPAYRVGVENVVERCYALANKPVRELTDAEIDAICRKTFGWAPDTKYDNDSYKKLAANLIAAHQRKQQEPETVKFRAARWMSDNHIEMHRSDIDLLSGWEWLEPTQEIEVTLP